MYMYLKFPTRKITRKEEDFFFTFFFYRRKILKIILKKNLRVTKNLLRSSPDKFQSRVRSAIRKFSQPAN